MAFLRAYHLKKESPVLFKDQYAIKLVGTFRRLLFSVPLLRWLILNVVHRRLQYFRFQSLIRSRFTEDCLDESIQKNLDQVVILGAGLDSFALRRNDLSEKVNVFEVDHPATQHWKIKRLASQGIPIPKNLTFAGVDFNYERAGDALIRAGFMSGKKTFISWLGVTYYVEKSAVLATLGQLALLCSSGSEICFDYAIPRGSMDDKDLGHMEWIDKKVKRKGEPLISNFIPEELEQHVEALGFRVVEHLNAHQQRERFLADRTDGMDTHGMCNLIRIQVE